MRHRLPTCLPLVVLGLSAVAIGDESAATIQDFTDGVDAVRLTGITGFDSTRPGGGGALGLTLGSDVSRAGWASLDVPADIDWSTVRALSAWVRVQPSTSPRKFRWLAFDGEGEGDGNLLFQQRVERRGTGAWTRVEWPLSVWRWGDRAGPWSDVRRLRLQVETKRTTIEVDDWAFEHGEEGPYGGEDWLDELAFAGEGRWSAGESVVVGTDVAGDALSEDDLGRIEGRLSAASAWIDRLFGSAVRPIHDAEPVPLLVFAEREAYTAFVARLGTAWFANIGEPKASGYTLQDLALSSWSDEHGWDRPVYLHEGVHALVARRLRIATRAKGADWLQEGLANHLQLCVYPDSLPRDRWTAVLEKAEPLDALVARSIPGRDYAAVASVWGWLIAEHPDKLPAIARALADGEGPTAAFATLGLSLADADSAWRAWAAEHLASLTAESPRHFPLPPEFAEE